MEVVGRKIERLRNGKNLSQKELADALSATGAKVVRETVTQWENGTRCLKADAIVRLASFFGVSADYLLGLSDVQTPDTEIQAICRKTGLSMAAVLELSYRHSHADDAEANFINQLVESDWFAKSVGATEADCEHT